MASGPVLHSMHKENRCNLISLWWLADEEEFENNYTADDDELGKEKDLDGEPFANAMRSL